ncbi:hypothetical protein CDSM653_00125 [Caldanaerobacter subterraneus subsp. pacificus DSM 12653]|uniref:Uncharacterized protein n=1 Tax=Caldanaerobacter subterraneus subsp. pacificus DSM 12653 TaxID=391606 RepID=A0A0F5PQ61_9THEO|nr:hypothetical protein CDSM653_00125 [Caldanaerobacter subterraneus subsp. pacificus DSM 12653]
MPQKFFNYPLDILPFVFGGYPSFAITNNYFTF